MLLNECVSKYADVPNIYSDAVGPVVHHPHTIESVHNGGSDNATTGN